MGPSIKILNGHPDDTEVAVGTEGEVCVTGACVTAGYLMREHMAADPNVEAYSKPSSPVGRMLRTGDKGYVDADGYLQLVGRFKEIINCGGEKVSPLEMEDQLLTNVTSIETCVCFASPADMLGEVVGVAVVRKAGTPEEVYPTLPEIRDGLPNVVPRFKPRVLVIMDAIPKGPTGKPKRIGLAQMLRIPAVEMTEDAVYRVEGKAVPGTTTGEGLAPLMKLDKFVPIGGLPQDDQPLKATPVWDFPLTIHLDVSPDLGPPQQSLHTLVIEDSLCNEYKLEVTTTGPPNSEEGKHTTKEWKIPREEVQEALNYVRARTHEYGMDWSAKIGEHGRYEDWCSTLVVSDPHKKLTHQWDLGCSCTPPGKLIRLLKLLELEQPELPPGYDEARDWVPPPNWPGPKGGGPPPEIKILSVEHL